jgi:hypothetical protein
MPIRWQVRVNAIEGLSLVFFFMVLSSLRLGLFRMEKIPGRLVARYGVFT